MIPGFNKQHAVSDISLSNTNLINLLIEKPGTISRCQQQLTKQTLSKLVLHTGTHAL